MTRTGMPDAVRLIAGLVYVLPLAAAALTAEQYIAQFNTLLNSRQAKIVWCRGGTAQDIRSYTEQYMWAQLQNSEIMCMDTKDGVVRQLTNNPGNDHLDMPSVTADGRRVTFFNRNAFKVYVIDWDGTNQRELAQAQGCHSSATWRGPDGSDWVCIATRSGSDLTNAYRINIDTQEKVLLWNKSGLGESQYNFWGALSADGTRMVADLWNYNGMDISVMTVPNGTATRLNTSGGCWPAIARGNSYLTLYTQDDHQNIYGRNADGSSAGRWNNVGSSLFGNMYNCMRISNDSSIVSVTNVNGGYTGPAVVKLNSGGSFAGVKMCEESGIYNGKADVFIYTGIATGRAPAITPVPDAVYGSGQAASITVQVNAEPRATLSASGLPSGISVQNGATPAASFTISGSSTAQGTYQVILTATNSEGTGRDTFRLTLQQDAVNTAPVVSAGADDSCLVNEMSVTLNGGVQDDGRVTPVTILWRQISGPSGAVVIASPSTPISGVQFAAAGAFLMELSANDGQYTARDTVRFTVSEGELFKVLSPTAGQALHIGRTYTIQWEVHPAMGVTIQLSLDDGDNWAYLVASSVNTTSWEWAVSPSLRPSTTCRLRIASYAGPSFYCQSGLFTIDTVSSAAVRWESHRAVLTNSTSRMGVIVSDGGDTAALAFMRSASSANPAGTAFAAYHAGPFPAAGFMTADYWADAGDVVFPYAGKCSAGRTGTGAPAPTGDAVRDIVLHPDNSSMAVTAFIAPFTGNYSVENAGVRRPLTEGATVTLKVFGPDLAALAALQAGNTGAWAVSSAISPRLLSTGQRLYFAVDADGDYGWDASQICFTVSASRAATTGPVAPRVRSVPCTAVRGAWRDRTLTITVGAPGTLRLYTASGSLVLKREMSPGTHTIALPAAQAVVFYGFTPVDGRRASGGAALVCGTR